MFLPISTARLGGVRTKPDRFLLTRVPAVDIAFSILLVGNTTAPPCPCEICDLAQAWGAQQRKVGWCDVGRIRSASSRSRLRRPLACEGEHRLLLCLDRFHWHPDSPGKPALPRSLS